MCTRILRLPAALALLVVGLLLAASAANATGLQKCGQKSVTSWSGYYKNLQKFGPAAVKQAAKINESAGYRPVDGSFNDWGKKRVIVAPLAKKVQISNYGCRPGAIGSAGLKTLTKGWEVLFALPDKYSKADIKVSKPKGKGAKDWKQIKLTGRLVGQATCSNPGEALVQVVVWVKKSQGKKPSDKPKPCGCDDKKPVPPVVAPPSTGSISQGDKVTQTAEQECSIKGGKYNHDTLKCEINQNSSTGGDSATTGNGSNTGGSTGGGGSQGGGGSGAGGNAGVCSSQGGNGGGAGGTTSSGSGGNGGAGGSAGSVDCSTNVSGNCNAVNSPGAVINCPGGATPTPTPVPNRGPTVQIVNAIPNGHVCAGVSTSGSYETPGTFVFRITASDPDGDNLGTPQATAKYGTVGTVTKTGDGQWTFRYTAPSFATTDEKVTVTVSDGKIVASANTSFPNPVQDLDHPSPTTC